MTKNKVMKMIFLQVDLSNNSFLFKKKRVIIAFCDLSFVRKLL